MMLSDHPKSRPCPPGIPGRAFSYMTALGRLPLPAFLQPLLDAGPLEFRHQRQHAKEHATGAVRRYRLCPHVKQATIKPLILGGVALGSLINTDEYAIYGRLPEWGFGDKTVHHGRGEYARDEDGDGLGRSPRQYHGRHLVAAALLTAATPWHLPEEATLLSRPLRARA